jgi:hypothetical protein
MSELFLFFCVFIFDLSFVRIVESWFTALKTETNKTISIERELIKQIFLFFFRRAILKVIYKMFGPRKRNVNLQAKHLANELSGNWFNISSDPLLSSPAKEGNTNEKNTKCGTAKLHMIKTKLRDTRATRWESWK